MNKKRNTAGKVPDSTVNNKRRYRIAGNSKHGRKKSINQPENNYEMEFPEIKKKKLTKII